jgi:hypothetical protein
VTNRFLEQCNDCLENKSSIDLDFSFFVKKQLNKVLDDLKQNNVTN